MEELLRRLAEKREAAAKEREELILKRKSITDIVALEAREDFNETEDTEFRTLTTEIKAKADAIEGFDTQIEELRAEVERTKQIQAASTVVRGAMNRLESVKEARMYEKGNGASYVRDFLAQSLGMDATGEARERLSRHANEVRTDKEFRDLARTDGSGGYAVPPLWVMSEFIELARSGRAYANLVQSKPLPGGTDSINIPKIATGTATAIQTADNAAVQETDLTDTFVNAPVRTIAGQQDVAIQLLDQSPVNFDELIFRDLIADHATKTDLQVIAGSGGSGQVLGVRGTSGIETIAFTGATVPLLYAKVADAIQRVHTLRFAQPTVIVMHPRRWAWFLAASDTAGHPLVVPTAQGPNNTVGTFGGVVSQQVVGTLQGLPVVTDPNIPITLGGGTEDVIHILKADDLVLYEGGIKTRVLPEVLSGTLTVRLQVYNYVAFTAARQPKSIVEIGGSGLATPTF